MTTVKQFHGTSRVSFKVKKSVGDVFYTFEFGETVEVDANLDSNIEQYELEKQKMWDRVDAEIAKKCTEVLNSQQN